MPDVRIPYRFADGETIDRHRVLANFRELQRAANAVGAAQIGTGAIPLSAVLTDGGLVTFEVPLIRSGAGVVNGTADVFAGTALGGEYRLKRHTLAVRTFPAAATLTVVVRRNGASVAATTIALPGDGDGTVPVSVTGLDVVFAANDLIEVRWTAGAGGTVSGARSILTFSKQFA